MMMPLAWNGLDGAGRARSVNHDGIEPAEPDLQSMFRKDGGDRASLRDSKRFAPAEANTDAGRRVVAGTAALPADLNNNS